MNRWDRCRRLWSARTFRPGKSLSSWRGSDCRAAGERADRRPRRSIRTSADDSARGMFVRRFRGRAGIFPRSDRQRRDHGGPRNRDHRVRHRRVRVCRRGRRARARDLGDGDPRHWSEISVSRLPRRAVFGSGSTGSSANNSCERPLGARRGPDSVRVARAEEVRPLVGRPTSSNLMGSSRLRWTNPGVWVLPKAPVVTRRVNHSEGKSGASRGTAEGFGAAKAVTTNS